MLFLYPEKKKIIQDVTFCFDHLSAPIDLSGLNDIPANWNKLKLSLHLLQRLALHRTPAERL